ncbi:MAG: RsmD family RNA methyltransferase, partial [bacterium]
MRIFSGSARGRFVGVPKDVKLRPTTDRVRLA